MSLNEAHVQVFPTPAALSYGAAEKISSVLSAAHMRGGVVSLVLSGGSTPRVVYELLASQGYQKRIDWSRLHVFWGDERCVAPESPESNYRMAHQALLREVPIPPHHIHRIRGELPPAEASRAYEVELHNVYGMAPGGIPHLTLVLLGIGEDGHTASLFPGSTAIGETQRLVAETFVQRLTTWRVTMTFPLLNQAELILFLVTGPTKAAIIRSVYRDERPDLPAARIARRRGETLWYIDRDAATLLNDSENA